MRENLKTTKQCHNIYEICIAFGFHVSQSLGPFPTRFTYSLCYSKRNSWRIEGLDWFPISVECAEQLDRSFLDKEVYCAVFQLNRDKALGLGGFTLALSQEC